MLADASSCKIPPLMSAYPAPEIGDCVLDLQRTAVRRFERAFIGDGVACIDGQRLVVDVGVNGRAAFVVERQAATDRARA